MGNPFKYGDIAYQDMQLVNRKDMSDMSVDPIAWGKMAETLQLIPISVSECKFVCKTLPIVFSPADKPMPIAITGFSPQKNTLVKQGRWKNNHYIPLAAKRYPFALAQINEEEKQLLYVDAKAIKNNKSTDSADYRLFDEKGENTETLNQAIKQCKIFDEQIQATSTIVQTIDAIGLFKETQLIITDKDGVERKTSPFKIIDVEKLTQLSDENIVKLQKCRGLWLIDAHIISMTNIESIAQQSLSL
ncbi:SapC family protein [Eionea flava]